MTSNGRDGAHDIVANVSKAPMSTKFNQLLLTSSFNKNLIGGISSGKTTTKIVSASISF